MRETADYVFKNGQVVTVDADALVTEAVAVADNRILRVGPDDAMADVTGPDTRVIDLRGRSVVPGFIDSHIHLAMGVQDLGLNLRYPHVKSLDDILEMVRRAAADSPPGTLIRGWGYDQNRLAEKRHPTRDELDAVAPDHPVVLIRTCEHMSVHNSRSLEMAGVREDEPDPSGGQICRDDRGRINGLMKELAHVRMIRSAPFTDEEIYEGLVAFDRTLCRYGITSVHDVGADRPLLPLFHKAQRSRRLNLRVYVGIYGDTLDYVRDFMKSGVLTGFGNRRLKIGPLKAMLDGSSSGPSSATRAPYTSDPTDSGILYFDQEEIDAFVDEANRLGYQVTAHAVGDRAVEQIVDAIEKALKAYPRKDHRHRIEHCAIVDDALLERIRALGIVPVGQPVFLYEFGDAYRVHYGEERLDRMFVGRSYLDRGIIAAASSDCPVTSPDPLLGIHLAVNRVTQSGRTVSQHERVGVMDALRLYTINGAYASFEEDIKGSLEPGKLADLAVLSAPILDCDPGQIKDIEVDATMIDGVLVHETT